MKQPISNLKKVEELVEWVELAGLTLSYAIIAYDRGKINNEVMDCYRDTFAKQILSHKDANGDPDLALIDREEMQKTGSVVIGTESERNFWMAGFKARGEICRKTYINLAEALKENDERVR